MRAGVGEPRPHEYTFRRVCARARRSHGFGQKFWESGRVEGTISKGKWAQPKKEARSSGVGGK